MYILTFKYMKVNGLNGMVDTFFSPSRRHPLHVAESIGESQSDDDVFIKYLAVHACWAYDHQPLQHKYTLHT